MSKRYIDADALIKDLESRRLVFKDTIRVADALRSQGRVMRKAIEEAPTADVVEVVRCKDCKYFYIDNECKCSFGHGLCRLKNGNQFCSYGERRE